MEKSLERDLVSLSWLTEDILAAAKSGDAPGACDRMMIDTAIRRLNEVLSLAAKPRKVA